MIAYADQVGWCGPVAAQYPPTLSIVVPTQGRPLLARCLNSMARQLERDDEVIVVADTHGPLQTDVADMVASFGERYRYLEHDAGFHHYGHPQCDAGMRGARAGWLAFIGDDDIYAPDAFARIRRAILETTKPAPMLFRFITPTEPRMILWEHPRLEAGKISAQCLVVPNIPAKLGEWDTSVYEADYRFIRTTVDRWGGDDAIVWKKDVLVLARPD